MLSNIPLHFHQLFQLQVLAVLRWYLAYILSLPDKEAQPKELWSENLHHLDEKIIAHLKSHFEKIFPAQQPITYEVVIVKLKQTGTPMGIQVPDKVVPAPIDKPLYPAEDINKDQ